MKEQLEQIYRILKDLEKGSETGADEMKSDFGKGLRNGEAIAYGQAANMLIRILADM